MDQLSQAKKWLARAAKATAITVLPLAAAAIAQAGVALNTGSGGCYASGGNQNQPSCTVTGLADTGIGSTGVRFDLNFPYVDGSYSTFDGYTSAAFGDLASGTVIPFAWSMGISSNTETPGGQLFVSYNTSEGEFGYQPFYFGGTGVHTGTGSFTLTNGFTSPNGWISLSFNAYAFAFNTDSQQASNEYIAAIDSLRIDFLPVDEGSEAPEPGTMMLGGTALALIGLVARRRRKA